jgi:serine/threonine-protein kinase
VAVLVSSGPAQVRVPDLSGDSRSGAEAALAAVGLAAGTVSEQVSTGASAGSVISQSPSSGTSVGAGSKVNLTLAKASSEVTVPKVVGQNVTQASAALGGAGFAPSVVQVAVSEQSKSGIVLKQTLAPGKTARKGSTVTMTVGVLETTTTPTTPTTPTTTTGTTTSASPPAPPAAGAG